jgi:hypothetical protein
VEVLLTFPEAKCMDCKDKGYSREMLTRQAMGKTIIVKLKNTYIFKLLNVVTAGTEALVKAGKMFLYAVSKKSAACGLSHIWTPSIKSSLLLKRLDPNQFFRWVKKW